MESTGEVIIYQNNNGQTAIEVRLQEETVWLNQQQFTELFNRDQSVVSRHIKNINQTLKDHLVKGYIVNENYSINSHVRYC